MELEQNQTATSLAVFMESYNKNLPLGFPQASVKTLKKFQILHPALFPASAPGATNGEEWSIIKHRKKLMDWLSSYCESA